MVHVFFSFHFLVISFHLFHLSSHFRKNFGQIRNRLESQGKFSYALKIGLPTERLLFKSIGGGGGGVVREMYLPESILYWNADLFMVILCLYIKYRTCHKLGFIVGMHNACCLESLQIPHWQ